MPPWSLTLVLQKYMGDRTIDLCLKGQDFRRGHGVARKRTFGAKLKYVAWAVILHGIIPLINIYAYEL